MAILVLSLGMIIQHSLLIISSFSVWNYSDGERAREREEWGLTFGIVGLGRRPTRHAIISSVVEPAMKFAEEPFSFWGFGFSLIFVLLKSTFSFPLRPHLLA